MKADSGGKIHGILVTFRRPEKLSVVLRALAAQDRKLDRLIVVDNAPSPEGKEIVLGGYRVGPTPEYVASPDNLGPAGAISLGMSRILGSADDRDWIVLVDDDNPPYSTTLLGNLKRFGESMRVRDSRTAAVGLIGARFDWKRGRLISMSGIANGHPDDAVPVDYVGGGRFPFYLVGAVRRVGTFSPELFFGFDDLEYGLRLGNAGFSLYAQAALWREARRTDRRLGLDSRPSINLSRPSWRRYYELRNMLHILRSVGRRGTALRILLIRGFGKPLFNLPVSPRAAMSLLRLNTRAFRDAWTGRLGRTLEPEGDDARTDDAS